MWLSILAPPGEINETPWKLKNSYQALGRVYYKKNKITSRKTSSPVPRIWWLWKLCTLASPGEKIVIPLFFFFFTNFFFITRKGKIANMKFRKLNEGLIISEGHYLYSDILKLPLSHVSMSSCNYVWLLTPSLLHFEMLLWVCGIFSIGLVKI